MANPIDFLTNEYMVFEADQVLTNDHLNQLFNYLDQQNRWTRNKLIGIGIVCGFNIVQHKGVIEVTKGCGITSQGYLILVELKKYTYYTPYTAIDEPTASLPFTYPGYLPFFAPYCDHHKPIFLLLTDSDYDALEPDAQKRAQTISSATDGKMLDDYAIILFLETNKTDLKNCDVFDCNNKGEKMMLQVRPLLVKKNNLPDLQERQYSSPPANHNIPLKQDALKEKTLSPVPDILPRRVHPSALKAPEINLKRFNVPYSDLKTAGDVINAFVKLVDDATLSSVAGAYNFCYEEYKDLLDVTTNPFTGMLKKLKAERDRILEEYPLFIQYFYDFIDDLIKAYFEFRSKMGMLLTACCPDENLFPLHLVLGEATATTGSFTKDPYRTCFIYSSLFAGRGNETDETVFLFRRMEIMLKEFTGTAQQTSVLLPSDILRAKALRGNRGKKDAADAIKITPSLYEQAWLSQRAIPYYYTVNEAGRELYKYWSYYRSIRGNASFNLGYHAYLYNSGSAVTEPLLYDIERYNFFRIEGHIGMGYVPALRNILQQRKNYNLPFDVVAIAAEQLVSSRTLPECNMQDLEANYKLLVSEFACKAHAVFCPVTRIPYPPDGKFSMAILIESILGSRNTLDKTAGKYTITSLSDLSSDYKRGDFMRTHCAPADNTTGSLYLKSLYNNVFRNPVELENWDDDTMQDPMRTQGDAGNEISHNVTIIKRDNTALAYYTVLEYIDSVEDVMLLLATSDTATFDTDKFQDSYKKFTKMALQLIRLMSRDEEQPYFSSQSGGDDDLEFNIFHLDLLVNKLHAAQLVCIDERMLTLKNEYNRRLQLYKLQRSFLHYYEKHPGLEHKAGVPKGGTFVLVYHSTRNILAGETDEDKAEIKTAAEESGSLLKVKGRPAEAAMQISMKGSTDAPENNDALFMDKIKGYINDFDNISADLKKSALDLINNLSRKPASTYTIADNAVIADFYVPYLCCSDCAPVAYILPEEGKRDPVETAEFDLQPRKFMYDDAHDYQFVTKPPVTKANVVQNPFTSTDDLKYGDGLTLWADEDNTLHIHPRMLELKQTLKTTVIYKDISLPITIVKPDAAFNVRIYKGTVNGESTPLIQLTAVNNDTDQYEWSVNNNNKLFLQGNATTDAISLMNFFLRAGNDTSEYHIQLKITYNLNGNISDNTKAGKITKDEMRAKSDAGDGNPFELKYETDE